jgi:hypothetical protein
MSHGDSGCQRSLATLRRIRIAMNAMTLLREVSDAYRSLKSLAVEATILTESGDEDSSQRTESRVRFFYSAPDRIRYEQPGSHGMLQISDGRELHTSFRTGLAGQPRYNSIPTSQMQRLPHLFRPDFPVAQGDAACLWQGIEQRVTAAEILRSEDGCHVVSVSYEPPPYPFLVCRSPVLFWIDATTRMVMRQQAEVGHRIPAEEEVNWSRHTVSIRSMQVNEPIPQDTFRFTPPPDASLEERRGCVSFGGGGGFAQHGADGHGLEHRAWHDWEGETLVEHSKWKIRGKTLVFERRLTFSPDNKDLHIAEHVTGPASQAEGSWDLPVA